MNPLILKYFSNIEEELLDNDCVVSYKILRQEIAYSEGKFRVKVTFIDRSIAELFEYVVISGGNLNLSKYSFHWQDEHGNLKFRWDNAPHHPELPNAPHHRHNSDESLNGLMETFDIFKILEEIRQLLIVEGLYD